MANDREKLYVSVKTGDEGIQRKILAGGMTLWLDPAARKEQAIGIRYPLKRQGPPVDGSGMRTRDRMSAERPPVRDSNAAHRSGMPIPNDLELLGFGACGGASTVHKTNSCGIVVRMDRNDYGELVWEAEVPLQALNLEAKPGQILDLGIEIGALNMPARPMGEDRSSGGGSGGMRGMGGGGMGSMGGGMGGMGGGFGGGGRGGGGGGMHGGGGPRPGGDPEGMSEKLTKSSMTWVRTALLVR